MKENKLTVGSNLRWESSRMMLPEHVGALLGHNRQVKETIKPELDQKEIEAFMRAICDSMSNHKVIEISLFDDYEDLKVVGVVDIIDQYLKRVKVDGEWFEIGKVIGVEIECE